MQHRFGWAVVALPLLFTFFTLSPLASYADNPKAILGKTCEILHDKRSIREVDPGIFIPTQSFETRIIRQQLRIEDNGDVIPVYSRLPKELLPGTWRSRISSARKSICSRTASGSIPGVFKDADSLIGSSAPRFNAIYCQPPTVFDLPTGRMALNRS